MQRINSAFGQFRMMVGLTDDDEVLPEEDLSFMDEFNRNCTLSPKQRLCGFAACLVLGLFCCFLSMFVFLHPVKFAITFTFGNLLGLGSTGFLIGPKQQLKMMLDAVRIIATVIYLGSILVALFCSLYLHSKLLTLLAIIIEFCALLWYCLSYIPFARVAATRCISNCLDTEI